VRVLRLYVPGRIGLPARCEERRFVERCAVPERAHVRAWEPVIDKTPGVGGFNRGVDIEIKILAGDVIEVDTRLRTCSGVLDPCFARPHVDAAAVLQDESNRFIVRCNCDVRHETAIGARTGTPLAVKAGPYTELQSEL
jgi:hypothetical protein